MPEPVVMLDSYKIREGKGETFKQSCADIFDFVRQNEPKMLFYNLYVNDETREAKGVQIYADAVAMEHHQNVAGPKFRKLFDMLEMESVTLEICGEPTHQMLQMMASHRPEVKAHVGGFSRLGAGPPGD